MQPVDLQPVDYSTLPPLSQPPKLGALLYQKTNKKTHCPNNWFIVGAVEKNRVICKDTQALYSLRECIAPPFDIVGCTVDSITDIPDYLNSDPNWIHHYYPAEIVLKLKQFRPSVKQLIWSALKVKMPNRDTVINRYLKTAKLMRDLPSSHPCNFYRVYEWIQSATDDVQWVGNPILSLQRLDWFLALYDDLPLRDNEIAAFVERVTTNQAVWIVVIDDPLASLILAGKANIFSVPDPLPSHVKRVGIHVRNFKPNPQHFNIVQSVYPNDPSVEDICNNKNWEKHTTHLIGFIDIKPTPKPTDLTGLNALINSNWDCCYKASMPAPIGYGYAEVAEGLTFPAPLEVIQQFHRYIKPSIMK